MKGKNEKRKGKRKSGSGEEGRGGRKGIREREKKTESERKDRGKREEGCAGRKVEGGPTTGEKGRNQKGEEYNAETVE